MLAIVPVKGLDGAKSRLAPVLDADGRRDLVLRMLGDVLAACQGAESVERILVVTPEPRLVDAGVDVLVDAGEGHPAAIRAALADPRSAVGALIVMADLPLVTPQALDRLAAFARPLALAPARDGGLNALALREPSAFEPAFGVPGAASVTTARARGAGLTARVVDDPVLAHDVDTPCDLRALRTKTAA